MHSYLIIAAEPSLKTVAFMTGNCVKDTIRERKWEPIHECRGIEFVVVDADPDFPVILRDDDDGA